MLLSFVKYSVVVPNLFSSRSLNNFLLVPGIIVATKQHAFPQRRITGVVPTRSFACSEPPLLSKKQKLELLQMPMTLLPSMQIQRKNLRRYLLEAKFTKGCNEYFPIPRL